MIRFLAKLFIKDYKNYLNTEVRVKYGILCGSVGILLNVLLFAFKLLGGIISGALSMIADAINNLSDAASSFVSIIGFKLSSKKPDSEHPFGHGRVEYITGLIVSFFILLMGVELFKSSIDSILNPKPIQTSPFTIIILVASILVKLYMFFYNHSVAKKINSVAMNATAKDSLSDMISTGVVILAIIFSKFTSFPVDGIAGLIVAIFIFIAGIDAAKETISPLLGKPPAKELVDEIEKEVLKFEPIVGIHDLVIHDYGPGRFMISIHAEVPGHLDIFDLHDVIDNAEIALGKKFNSSVIIHMDPIDLDNPQIKEYKEFIYQILKPVHKDLSVHDFRIVPGNTHTNILFDIVRPYECKLSDDELISLVQTEVRNKYGNVNCIIMIDNPYV